MRTLAGVENIVCEGGYGMINDIVVQWLEFHTLD